MIIFLFISLYYNMFRYSLRRLYSNNPWDYASTTRDLVILSLDSDIDSYHRAWQREVQRREVQRLKVQQRKRRKPQEHRKLPIKLDDWDYDLLVNPHLITQKTILFPPGV